MLSELEVVSFWKVELATSREELKATEGTLDEDRWADLRGLLGESGEPARSAFRQLFEAAPSIEAGASLLEAYADELGVDSRARDDFNLWLRHVTIENQEVAELLAALERHR